MQSIRCIETVKNKRCSILLFHFLKEDDKRLYVNQSLISIIDMETLLPPNRIVMYV